MFIGEHGYPEPCTVTQIAYESGRKAVNLASFFLAVSGNGAVFLAGNHDVAALEFSQIALQLTGIKLVVWKGVNRGARIFSTCLGGTKAAFVIIAVPTGNL